MYYVCSCFKKNILVLVQEYFKITNDVEYNKAKNTLGTTGTVLMQPVF